MTLIIYNNAEENAIGNRRKKGFTSLAGGFLYTKNWLAGCGPDKMIIQMQ